MSMEKQKEKRGLGALSHSDKNRPVKHKNLKVGGLGPASKSPSRN
ncbi:hypothetical protein [Atlantibacter hermannii]|nr:hypothetical protein [Atlantibacter hermannii]